MSILLDTSVLIAALVETQDHHPACLALLDQPNVYVCGHSLLETFSILTGGRLGSRLSPALATQVIQESLLNSVEVITLSSREIVAALGEAETRGIRGGAVYDYLHLAAARKVKAAKLHTLNVSDFRSFSRAGDPKITHP